MRVYNLKFTDQEQAEVFIGPMFTKTIDEENVENWSGESISPFPCDDGCHVVKIANSDIAKHKWLTQGDQPKDEEGFPILPEVTGYHVDILIHSNLPEGLESFLVTPNTSAHYFGGFEPVEQYNNEVQL